MEADRTKIKDLEIGGEYMDTSKEYIKMNEKAKEFHAELKTAWLTAKVEAEKYDDLWRELEYTKTNLEGVEKKLGERLGESGEKKLPTKKKLIDIIMNTPITVIKVGVKENCIDADIAVSDIADAIYRYLHPKASEKTQCSARLTTKPKVKKKG